MADVGHHNAAAWLDHFELRTIDVSKQPAHAVLSPKPAAGHAIRFATAPRLERLGQHLTRLSGVAVRVQLAEVPTAQQQHDRRIAEAEIDTGSGANAAAKPSAPSGGGGIDRRDALGLPIVRDAFEVFPDAIMIDARKKDPPPTQTPTD
ncbi:MAG: hypothetical protein AAF328_00730 [Planctomycetota bacterium]